MAYNMNTDYKAIMNEALAKGDMAAYAQAEASRNEKIAAMNAAGTNVNGYTPTYTSTIPTGYTGSTKTSGNVSATAQSIINQMNVNSIKWYMDPANKAQYAAANKALAQQLAALKETDTNGSVVTYTPAYDAASGTWQVTPSYTQASAMDNLGVKVTQPSLSGLELGNMYGIEYNQNIIKKLLDDATRAEYALKNQQQIQSENKLYGTLLDTQGTALESLRKAQASAVATGASRGMAAANELSAILNLQQTATDEATTLTQARNNLGAEEAAAYTKNTSKALDTSNELKQAIANLALTKYGYDTQGYAANLSYLAALADVAAQKYSADTTLEGVKYNADANVAASGKTYGTSGYTYTSGNSSKTSSGGTSTSTSTSTSAADTALKVEAAGNNGYTPEGTDLVIYKNSDGVTYTIKKPGYSTITDATADELEKIKNNDWDVESLNEGYGSTSFSGSYNVVDESKINTAAEALNFANKFGRLPSGWAYGQGATGVYKTQGSTTNSTNQVKYNTTIAATDGKKVSVGYGNYATVWTYNNKTGLWTNSGGSTMSAAKFKTYLSTQPAQYIKALN